MKSLLVTGLVFLAFQALGEIVSGAKGIWAFPGEGKFEFAQEGKKIPLRFGSQANDIKTTAFLFPRVQLPGEKEKPNDTIQIVFAQEVGAGEPWLQLGSVIFEGKLSAKTPLVAKVQAGGAGTGSMNQAALIFTPLEAARKKNDQERLQGTCFGISGTAKLSHQGLSHEANSGSESLTFVAQPIELELDAHLACPFNSDESDLKGKISLTLLKPKSPAAIELAQILAEKIKGPRPPSELLQPKRALSTKP